MANYRSVHTKFWNDPKVEKLSGVARCLFIYLFTNEHRNESGLYALSMGKMSYEIGFPVKQVEKALGELRDINRVHYDVENEVVWVVNAARHSPLNDNCVKSITRDLEFCSSPTLVQLFCSHYTNHLLLQEVSKRFGNGSIDGLANPLYKEQGTGNKVQGTGNKDKNIEAEKKEKQTFGEFGNVTMTEEQYGRLVETLGSKERAQRAIEILSSYKESKGKKYKSDYATFGSWVIGKLNNEEKNNGRGNASKGRAEYRESDIERSVQRNTAPIG